MATFERPFTHRLTAAAVLCLAATAATAQSNDPIQARTQFNFSNPGARSLGMAGAFTARADDATAVYANPAGLVQLTLPEVSLDLRSWRFTNRVIDGGTQLEVGKPDGISFSRSDDRLQGVSFLSAFLPRKTWAFGVFRHELVRYRAEIHSQETNLATGGIVRPVDGFYDASVENLGVALAVRLGERFSVGASVGQARFELSSRLERWCKPRSQAGDGTCPASETAVLGSPFGNSPQDIILYWTQEQGGETDVAISAGLLWQSPRKIAAVASGAGAEFASSVRGAPHRPRDPPVVSIGLVYRPGPEFSYQAQMITKGRTSRDFFSRISPDSPPPGCSSASGCVGTFKVPDTIGLGLSIRPSLPWVVAIDVNRVEYSDLLDQAIDSLGLGPMGPGAPLERGLFRLDDGVEVRLGAELALVRERRLPDVFLRFGAWNDPDHKMSYEGETETLQQIFAPGRDEIHYAAGIGLRYRRFQIDAGLDLSGPVDTVSLAAIYYLGPR